LSDHAENTVDNKTVRWNGILLRAMVYNGTTYNTVYGRPIVVKSEVK